MRYTEPTNYIVICISVMSSFSIQSTFFRQHNCSTLDSQQKYHSRASALYKEKLANMSAQSMRMYGTQVNNDNKMVILVKKIMKVKILNYLALH